MLLLLMWISFLKIAFGSTPKCRALVLSGGGAKGSYQAGVIFGVVNTTVALSKQYPNKISEEEIQYDVISGTSVGSINAIPFILFPKGEEIKAVKMFLYDSSPLKNTLLKNIMSSITAVNLNTGITERLTEQNFIHSIENLANATMCSSAIPGVFPPQYCGSQLYIDGGSL